MRRVLQFALAASVLAAVVVEAGPASARDPWSAISGVAQGVGDSSGEQDAGGGEHPWAHLPVEVIRQHVLSELTSYELWRICLVDQRLRQLCADPMMWQARLPSLSSHRLTLVASLGDPSSRLVDLVAAEHGRRMATVAGDGQLGRNGGPTAAVRLSYPTGVVVDRAGNLIFADTEGSRILRIDADGLISTIVGDGQEGYAGDGGPAISARLNTPQGVTIDAAGNLFIADTLNQRIRKVDTAGNISTVAGDGQGGFGGDGGPAINAQMLYPTGVAVDVAGNLFVTDKLNHRIRKVDTAGNISTVAGDGQWGFAGDGGPAIYARITYPAGVAVDAVGNIFFADSYNNRIRKVNTAGNISTVAGNGQEGFDGDGGPALSAQLNNPLGLAVDAAGNLFIADTLNQRIRKVNTAGNISTVAGNGQEGFGGDGEPVTEVQFNNPQGIAVDVNGRVHITDTINNRIRRFEP